MKQELQFLDKKERMQRFITLSHIMPSEVKIWEKRQKWTQKPLPEFSLQQTNPGKIRILKQGHKKQRAERKARNKSSGGKSSSSPIISSLACSTFAREKIRKLRNRPSKRKGFQALNPFPAPWPDMASSPARSR